MKDHIRIKLPYYPELKVSDYTSVDGTVEFYGRINSLLSSSMKVLDFGAGRAFWFEDDTCMYRKQVRLLKGKVATVVGCDVDEKILENRSVDERVKIKLGEKLPFDDSSIDLIVCDYVFEHVSDPRSLSEELFRILKPGGWICARTPNKHSYVGVGTRLIQNVHHFDFLKHAQPERKEIDVFPTVFLLNSIKDISKYFDSGRFVNCSYTYGAEPVYFFNNRVIFFLLYMINKFLPAMLRINLFVFLRKR